MKRAFAPQNWEDTSTRHVNEDLVHKSRIEDVALSEKPEAAGISCMRRCQKAHQTSRSARGTRCSQLQPTLKPQGLQSSSLWLINSVCLRPRA